MARGQPAGGDDVGEPVPASEPVAAQHGTESARPPGRPWLRGVQFFTLLLVAGLLALLIWQVVARQAGPRLVAEIKAQKKPPAPPFNLTVIWPHTETWPKRLRPAVADGRVSLSELRGYPVVINFWASWCVPCKDEAPRLAAAARSHAGRVAFLGIDVQDFTSDARRFLGRYQANYVSIRDGGSTTYDRYGLTGIPETYYLDRRGRILAHSIGEVSKAELEQEIRLIADTPE